MPTSQQGLRSEKRDWLKNAVDELKAKGLTQRSIAERMGERETALSGRLSGARGVSDKYIDKFQRTFGIAFDKSQEAAQVFTKEDFDRMVEKTKDLVDNNTRLIQIIDRLSARNEELQFQLDQTRSK